jgi:hypothetical protein
MVHHASRVAPWVNKMRGLVLCAFRSHGVMLNGRSSHAGTGQEDMRVLQPPVPEARLAGHDAGPAMHTPGVRVCACVLALPQFGPYPGPLLRMFVMRATRYWSVAVRGFERLLPAVFWQDCF